MIDVSVADCLTWFAAQPADSIDLVIGSPPYQDARVYDARLSISRKTEEWVAWMVEVYRAALRCCKGLVAFVVNGRTKDFEYNCAPERLVTALWQAGICQRKPPAYKRNGIPGSGGPDFLRDDWEPIICATRGGKLPWSDNTAMGTAPKCKPGGNPSHRRADDRRVKGRKYKPPKIANPGNVIDCGAVGGGNMGDRICHKSVAPFPEKLAQSMILTFCQPGGVVCDPFCGSGTVAAMAAKFNRQFRGCDIQAEQVNFTHQRVANVQPVLPAVFDPPKGPKVVTDRERQESRAARNERRRIRRATARQGKVCPKCGKTFDASRRDSVYCSPACRQSAYRVRYG